MFSIINIDSLNIQFGNTNAVELFNLNICDGEFISIVGPSGCGKTSVLNVLAGLNVGYSGEVLISNNKPTPGDLNIAYMLARDCLLPWRNTLDNAAYGLEIRGEPLDSRLCRAKKILKQVGLSDFQNSWPKELSHGMRQRVALARTFCLSSKILLMDEPFGALDAQTKIQLEDILLDLWSYEKRTIIFITHDLAEAIALSDRVIIMSQRPGRIIADVKIDIPRPRSVRELQSDNRFLQLYGEIWKIFESGVSHV